MRTDTRLNSDAAEPVRFDRAAPAAGLVALVLGLGMVFAMLNPGTAYQAIGSYMFAFMFWGSLTLGFLGLTLLHHAIRPTWGVSMLRLLEAGGGWQMLVTLAALFVPVVLGRHILYEWTHAEVVAADVVLQRKAWFLNETGFFIRSAVYFAVWIFFAWFMRRSTLKQEETGDFKLEAGRGSWGAAGMVAFFLTATFAFVDWGMSMEPHWFSSMYPLWFIVGSALGALSLSVLLITNRAGQEPYRSIINPNLTKDLGNLLFTVTMLWGYTNFSQYLIIWNGNIPEFTQYFVRRSGNGWNMVGMALILGQFFVPFFALLAPRVKRTPERLAKIAAWIFAFHIVDVFITIVPAVPFRHAEGAHADSLRAAYSALPLWTDALAFAAVGAIWFFVFASVTRGRALLPSYDRRLQEAMNHAH